MQIRALAATGLLLLAGCGKGGTLTTDSAAPLVLNAVMTKCTATTLEVTAVNNFPALDSFIQGLPAKGYTSVPAGHNIWGDAINLAFSYTFKNVPMTVKYNGENTPRNVWDKRIIQACFFVPESVNIHDVTVDQTGKSAVVTFTYGPPIHTQIATDFLAAGGHSPLLDIDSQAKSTLWTTEHRAYMQRLDDTGWRVNAIDSILG